MSCDPGQADLQTSSQRLNLSASNSAVVELKPECCIDDVIHHEVKEIGTHMWATPAFLCNLSLSWHISFIYFPFLLIPSLVCAVSYTTQYGEKLYFRKFFKFQVSWQQSSSCVSLEETWEMSQVCNRANAITVQAMDLVSCLWCRPSVCELNVTSFSSQ